MRIKKLLKNKLTYYFASLAISLFFLGLNSVSAATLSLSANSTNVSAGETVTLYVILNSEGVAVNNAEATIKFPTELFDIISISKGGSIFSLWVEEPSFSNSSGVISFNGGSPTPGFTGARGSIISIVAKAKKTGQAEFSFSSAAVRANDGLGTDVLRGRYGNIIVVAEKEAPVKVPPTTPTTPEPGKEIPPVVPSTTAQSTSLQISSVTHPDQAQWYKDKNPSFQWALAKDINAVQTGIGDSNSFSPSVIYSPAISRKTVTNLEDGTWYFKVSARKDTAWGPVTTYIARIDTTVPEKKNIEFNYDNDNKKLNIIADVADSGSGLDHYELFLNDGLIKTITPEEFIGGKFSLDLYALGENVVKLVVFDKAGNSIEALGNFYSTGILVPPLEPVIPEVEPVAPQLSMIPKLLVADDKLIIQGNTQTPDTDVTINVVWENSDSMVFKTKSNSEFNFFALIPNLKAGNYEIWAEISFNDKIISSEHLRTKATSQSLTKLGSFTFRTLSVVGLMFIIVLLLIIAAFFLGKHFSLASTEQNISVASVKKNNAKILAFLKNNLEKHLELIHDIRHRRVLTREEKKIKKSLEDGLDEVDKWLQ
jgi:hypothetical protein